MEWSFTIEFDAGTDGPDIRVIDQLGLLLVKHHGAVHFTDSTYGATIWLQADNADRAIKAGRRIVENACEKLSISGRPIIRLQATEWTFFARELERPTIPRLVGAQEAAKMIGVSRQRFHEIRRTRDFPKPLTEVAATPLWARAGVTAFLERWERKSGRPSGANAHLA